MRRVRPGPELEAARRQIREGWAEEESALRPPPFPILGLTVPHPTPVALHGVESADGEVTGVGLGYGVGEPAAHPQIAVSTYPLDKNPYPPDLAGLVRTLDPSEWDAWPRESDRETTVSIAGQYCPAEVVRKGAAWVLRAETTVGGVGLLVGVLSRTWPLEEATLAQVEDLEVFLAGRREQMEALFAREPGRPPPEEWDLPAVRGTEAHVELARSTSAHLRAVHAAVTEGRRPPRPEDGSPERWERATRAQIALTGQERPEAEDAVHSMINHLGELAQHADWFHADLAEQALAETIEYVALSRDVPSAPAQRAWSRWQDHLRDRPHRDRPRFGPEAKQTQDEAAGQRRWFQETSLLQREWETAWQHWVDERRE